MSKIKYIFLFLLLIKTITLQAQQTHFNHAAAMNEVLAQKDVNFQNGLQNHIQNISTLAQSPPQTAGFAAPVLTIPVVVHVIHAPNDLVGQNTNITIAQVQSQIDKLNQAFRKNDPNFANTPTVFQNLATDADIEFCLANIDPNGNPTNGILRHSYPTSSITNVNYIETSIKPATQWSPANYLNIWTVAIPNTNIFGGIQGYSYSPVNGFAGVSPLDGVVIDYRFFGVGDEAIGSGVATVRETGRYLGLLDIWGMNGTNGLPLGCSSDDGLTDTPDQVAPTGMTYADCPTAIPTSCGSNDMYTNYMDYMRADECQTMFTSEQVNVMRSVLIGLGSTVGLGNRNGLITSSLTACTNSCNISLAVSTTPESCGGLMNGTASVNATGGTVPYTYAWNTSPVQTINTATGLSAGTYQVTVTDANACQQINLVTISTASNLVVNLSTTDETCTGDDGTATANVTGGTPPYTTTWFITPPIPQVGNTVTGLKTGFYPYVTTDALGCMEQGIVEIPNNCVSVCDTHDYVPFLNLISPDLYFNSYSGGFLAGSNGYGDIAMANYTDYQGNHTHVIGLFIGMGVATGSDSLEFVVWDDANGGPGSELGSQKVAMSELNANLAQIYSFHFDEFVPVSQAFYVGFKIPDMANGDTIAFATNTIGDAEDSSNIAWTQRSDGSWHSFLEDWHEDMGVGVIPILATPPHLEFTPTNVTICDTSAFVQFNNLSTNAPEIEWILNGADTISPIAISPMVSYSTVGIYDATLIGVNGCVSDTLTIPNAVTVNDCPTGCDLYATLTQTEALCGDNGSATVTPVNGTAPYNILWSTNETTNTISNLIAGTYTVTVTDANNCSVVGTVTITTPTTILTITSTAINETCTQNDGAAIINVNGGVTPYNILWNTNATTDSLANLTAGTYTVTVTDANGCSMSDTIIVAIPPVLNLDSLIKNDLSCNNANDGNAAIYISGGTTPYTYNWSNGADTSHIQNLSSGSYFVTVTDTTGCELMDSVTINEPTALAINVLNLTNVNCNGQNTGSITIEALGGTLPYTYNWSNNLTTTSISNLMAGSYTVTVSDSNNCNEMLTLNINEPSPMTIDTMDVIHIDCNGGLTGSATFFANGGVAPYDYIWSNNDLDSTITNVGAGTYTITVTDVNNCSMIDSVIINEPNPIAISIQNIMHVNCAGAASGSASVSVTGGTTPYSYLWSNNSTTNSISNVNTGLYIVTITDANNCSDTLHVNILQNATVTIGNIDTTHILCHGANTGGYIITPNGGTAPYSYTWSTNPAIDTFNTITGLNAGIYTITITDASGCVIAQTLTLTEPIAITSTTSGQNLNCANAQTGAANVIASGGTSPYNYSWNTSSSNSPTISNMGAGLHIVTITDLNGCMHIDTAIITAPPAINIVITTTPVSCAGGNNGTATATVTGGVGGFTYLWNSFQIGQTATGLIAGQQILVVTDANGCQETDTVNIGTVPSLTLGSIVTQPVSCNGGSDGTATIQVGGGTAPYNFNWNTTPIQTTPTATNLAQGTYNVSITDANGCTVPPVTVVIGEPTPLTLDTILVAHPLCNGGNNGLIQVSASGGTANYLYNWSNGNTGSIVLDLTANTYTVIATDANGCNASMDITLTEPLPLSVQTVSTPTSCFGSEDGTISITAAIGGTSPYTYSINGNISQSISVTSSGLTGGIYTLTLEDMNGCTLQESVEVGEPDELFLDLGQDLDIILGEVIGLHATTNVDSSLLNYTWIAQDSSISCLDCPSPMIYPINSQNYTVSITDTNGCTTSDEIFIRVIKERRVFIPNIFSPNGDGYNDELIVYGGTGVEEILQFKVFNRWGEMIHSADNFAPNSVAHGWDGRQNGVLLAPSVFVYMVEVRFSDGLTHIYKGGITLFK
jgi:gliding motility-associated-like protein